MSSFSTSLLEALKQLGLSEDEARLYHRLLEEGSATVGELSRHINHSRTKIYGLLDNLVARGCVELVQDHPRTFAPQDPRLIAARHRQRTEKAYSLAQTELAQLYEQHRRPHSETRTLRDNEVYSQVLAMCQRATQRLDVMAAFLPADAPVQVKEALREAARRGVQVRVLLSDRLRGAEGLPPLDLFQVRVAPTPAAGILIIDDSELLIGGLEEYPPTPGVPAPLLGVWLRNPELVKLSRLLFKQLYQRGEPL